MTISVSKDVMDKVERTLRDLDSARQFFEEADDDYVEIAILQLRAAELAATNALREATKERLDAKHGDWR